LLFAICDTGYICAEEFNLRYPKVGYPHVQKMGLKIVTERHQESVTPVSFRWSRLQRVILPGLTGTLRLIGHW